MFLQVYSVSRNGQLFVFQCDTELADLIEVDKSNTDASASDESDDETKSESVKKSKGSSVIFTSSRF
jgi:hypothetical protein